MTEPSHPDPLDAWPDLLAALDEPQLEALAVTVAALTGGHLEAGELAEFADEGLRVGLALDLAVMQGPAAVAAKQRADTRASLVADIEELAVSVLGLASDLEMAAGRLYDFDDDQAA
jgi:hypothetical protein